jgi:hypothetical protein
MSHHTIIKGCLSIALALSLQPYAQAQQASVSESSQTTTVGPAQVIDSYMKPTVVRTRESTDGDGNVEKTVEPIVQERHERVLIPTVQTTTTDVRSAANTVKTETHQVAASTSHSSCAVKKVSHHPRHQRVYTAHRTHAAVASQVTTTVQPTTTVERQQTTTERDTVIERKDPSLDNN